MRDDAARGDFSAVLCWDQDRFGRFDVLTAGYYIHPFRQAGVRLLTVAQGEIDWEDFSGRLMYMIQQEQKNAFLVDLSRNSTRGKIATFKKGEWSGGTPPLGFLVRNRRLAIDEETAPIVRAIFRYYLEEESLSAVAKRLAREGIETPQGGLWDSVRIQRILRNPVYIGTYVLGRRHGGKYFKASEEGPVRAKGGKPPAEMRIENNHPAIISKETFDRCAELMERRKRFTSNRGEKVHLFTGLLRCAHCGGSMVANSRPGTKKTFYLCSNYRRFGSRQCQRHVIDEAPLESFFLRMIRERFTDPEQLDRLAAAIREAAKERRRNAPKGNDGDGLRRRLAKLDKDIDRGAERLLAAPDAIVATLTEKLRAWQDERAEIKARLDEIEHEDPGTARPVNEVVAAVVGDLKTLDQDLSTEERPVLQSKFRELVDRIELLFTRKPINPGSDKYRCDVSKCVVHLSRGMSIPVVASSRA